MAYQKKLNAWMQSKLKEYDTDKKVKAKHDKKHGDRKKFRCSSSSSSISSSYRSDADNPVPNPLRASLESKIEKQVAEKDIANTLGLRKEEAPAKAAVEDKKEAGRDFMAEKMARKVAEMPDVDPDIDLAALRAKAKAGANFSDEEKKARGLLYDTSKAAAVREESEEDEDDESCNMGGDPFEGM